MTFHNRIGREGGTRMKRALGVQAALEWAFRIEKAQLDLPPPQDATEEGFGFGLEYVLMQRAAGNEAALQFIAFLRSDKALSIMRNYGYEEG